MLNMNIFIFWFYLNILLKNLDIFVNHFWKFSFTFKNADKFKRRKWIEFLHIFWQISDKYQTPLNLSKIWIDELLWWIFSFWIEKLSWFQVNSSLTFQSQLESWRLGKHSELFCLCIFPVWRGLKHSKAIKDFNSDPSKVSSGHSSDLQILQMAKFCLVLPIFKAMTSYDNIQLLNDNNNAYDIMQYDKC